MKILLIGSGGREHALAWKIRQSPHCTELFCAPGNPGIAALATCVPLKADDIAGLVAFAHEQKIDLTVVGPEAPLVAGIADVFKQEGLPVFGPSGAAARIEGSKAFAKMIMQEAGVPTGRATECRDADAALRALDEFAPPYVIKADGLAAGKGVVIAASKSGAEDAIRSMVVDRIFGDAGTTVLIEEFLAGEELSVFGLSDGRNVVAMEPAQDHKRVGEGDTGPNTGGMGAYSPVPHLPATIMQETLDRVLRPTVAAMAARGTPYRGLLYAGLILTPNGLRVIEFNCRFGDPETEVILPRLQDDLVTLMLGCAGTGLNVDRLTFSPGAAVTVVAASGGYPGTYASGKPITGIEDAGRDGALVFHAGTAMQDGRLVTAGGRVLNVVGRAPALADAAEQAFAATRRISFEGMHWRRDIGARALGKAAAL